MHYENVEVEMHSGYIFCWFSKYIVSMWNAKFENSKMCYYDYYKNPFLSQSLICK